jgi:tRNA A37 methylthiotransferase MiaB
MNTIIFDTHKFIKNLQAKGISEEHSEVIVETMVGIQNAASEILTTKTDTTQFKSDLKHDIEVSENRLLHKIKDEVAPIKTEVSNIKILYTHRI